MCVYSTQFISLVHMGAEQGSYVYLLLIYAFGGVLGCALAIVLGFFLGKATYRRRIYGRLQKGN